MNTYMETLRPLVERHVETLRREGSDAIEALESDAPHMDRAVEALHKIKGSSGSIGFKEFSILSTRFHGHVKTLREINSRGLDDEGKNLLHDFKIALRNLKPEQSNLYQIRATG